MEGALRWKGLDSTQYLTQELVFLAMGSATGHEGAVCGTPDRTHGPLQCEGAECGTRCSVRPRLWSDSVLQTPKIQGKQMGEN